MSKYIIDGGRELCGSINIQSAKNSVLPLLAASILTDEKVILHNCPDISDVQNMIAILREMGCTVTFDNGTIEVDSVNIAEKQIPSMLAKELRSSIFILGPILSRLKEAHVAYPGGCEIGLRPIDIHLKGLKDLNIAVKEEGGYIYCDSRNMRASDIILDIPSVGATENLIMASVLGKGTTIIRNPAKEPEIQDLQGMLNAMGAKISGAGGSLIAVEGVEKLHGIEYTPIPDRIAAGTYIIATCMCGGSVELNNVVYEHIYSLLSKLPKTTCKITQNSGKLYIKSGSRHKSLDKIETMYYPGFPTDMQSQISAFATVCQGTTVITENIFETRFKQISEFRKMGADIIVKDRTAIIKGVGKLTGAEVTCEDLRGGASLVLMGLKADGMTIVNDVKHIERGYQNFDGSLRALGANIRRIN